MAQPTIGDVHINTALSNISIAYRNPSYIADQIFPGIPVTKQSDNYYIWTKDFWFRLYVQQRTPGDTYPEGALELSNTPYAASIYHLAYPVPDENRKNSDEAIDLDTAGAEWLADQFMLNRETNLATKIFATGKWATDRTLVAGEQWDNFDSADSDPQTHINTAKETIQKSTGALPNTCLMGQEVFNRVRRHPQLLDMYKHTGVPRLNAQQVADALEVDQVIVGSAIENTANEGATFSGGYIWGKSCLLTHVAPSPGLMKASAGYTFVWNIDDAGLPVVVTTIREDTRDRDLHRAKHAFDQKITATDLGYFLDAVVS